MRTDKLAQARTMFCVRKGEYLCFMATETLAQVARRTFPELKGGHIKNVLYRKSGGALNAQNSC